ncbi:MAG: transmembrane sensor [Cyclobacteriaceae bacterium]|jgi:ferric-dicitrate binding protein FerR (iron transport regulator)
MKYDINTIIAKELAGEATTAEIEILKTWLDEDKNNRSEYNLIRLNWAQGNESIQHSKNRVLNKLSKKTGVDAETPIRSIQKGSSLSWGYWAKVAATLILVGTIALLFYKNFDNSANVQVAKSELITKENPKGVKRQVKLPDGTHVWLNAESSISYLPTFTDSSRIVKLEGEAYFEVVKDASRPFQVESEGIVTTALGTAFNVNAFSKSKLSTVSLAEGRVKVELVSNGEVLYLNPGYSAIHNKNESALDTKAFDSEFNLAWKDGILIFKDADENIVFEKLESWYGVKFELENKSLKKWNLTSKFQNKNLEEILKVIGFKMKFDYKIENKTVTIKYLKN